MKYEIYIQYIIQNFKCNNFSLLLVNKTYRLYNAFTMQNLISVGIHVR